MDFAAGMMVGCLVGVISAVLLLFISTLTDQHRDKKSELSLGGVVGTVVALLATGGLSYLLKINKNSATLLLLLSVLLIARLGGFRYGIVASVIAPLLLFVCSYPRLAACGSSAQMTSWLWHCSF
ncbi:MAG TPA: hypothetical protein VKE24_13940 [Candidatus Acidoferrales bacterium]|nr:hypothetical protein [Candidatus Acidoferrales bacterium]